MFRGGPEGKKVLPFPPRNFLPPVRDILALRLLPDPTTRGRRPTPPPSPPVGACQDGGFGGKPSKRRCRRCGPCSGHVGVPTGSPLPLPPPDSRDETVGRQRRPAVHRPAKAGLLAPSPLTDSAHRNKTLRGKCGPNRAARASPGKVIGSRVTRGTSVTLWPFHERRLNKQKNKKKAK